MPLMPWKTVEIMFICDHLAVHALFGSLSVAGHTPLYKNSTNVWQKYPYVIYLKGIPLYNELLKPPVIRHLKTTGYKTP